MPDVRPQAAREKNDVLMDIIYQTTRIWRQREHSLWVVLLAKVRRLCLKLQTIPDHRQQNPGAIRDRAQINQKAESLLTSYGNHILRLAYSYLHNMDDAEEMLQETLIQYLKHAPVFETPAHEKAWLLRVTANLSKNRISYNKIRSTDQLRDTLAAERREDLTFVWEAVKELPKIQRGHSSLLL